MEDTEVGSHSSPLEDRDTNMNEGDAIKDTEVAPALITVHPTHKSVAVAVGSELRIFDLQTSCTISLVDDSVSPFHKDVIRAIRYGVKGKLFVSAGDDKVVKIWSTESWRCISTLSSEKRVSAIAVSNDGLYICFADKFGVVWVVDLDGFEEIKPLVNKKPMALLSHYCSIITSLEFSPDGRFIVSADRDFKIRVSIFPKKPLEGAHEIQSFCLGHTEYVSSLAFICAENYPQGYLISGSGDSTVRLWDITSGTLLDTCLVGIKTGLLDDDTGDENNCAVTDLCTTLGDTVVAVAIQSLRGIALLNCDLCSQTLSIAKVVTVMGDTFIPTSLGGSPSAGYLWMVAGISGLRDLYEPAFCCVKVISLEHETTVLEDANVPGGEKLLEKLQGSSSVDNEVLSAAAEAVRAAMCSLLRKKQYSADRREFRKRTRNDRKIKR